TLPTPNARTGFAFVGWFNTNASTGGTQITSNSIVPSANTTYWARWSNNTITISWDARGGTVTPATSNLTPGQRFGVLPTPSHPDCNFRGWFTGINGTGTQISSDSIVPASNTTYYAKWTVTISWRVNNSLIGMPQTSELIPGTAFGELPIVTLADCTFHGWFTGINGSGTKILPGSIVPDRHTTYYGEWRATITWNYNGGTGLVASHVMRVGTAIGTLPIPYARTGYSFVGWFDTSANAGGTQITSTSIVIGANVTYWARWTAVNQAITLTLDTPVTVTITAGGRREVRFTAPTAGTYSFESTNRGLLDPKAFTNATGSAYHDDNSGTDSRNYKFRQTLTAGQVFTYYSGVYSEVASVNGSYTVKVTAVLFDSVIITWNYNGVTGSPPYSELIPGTTFGELPRPNDWGEYIFFGWYDSSNFMEATRITSTSIVPAGNTTYWARWIMTI
ncbi:MAG: InlB B-repeat-containing protein, partial [Peptococcaceae bacterium]|nr:InlB B-repeat-containing protein [Peptococcaceae bacterium]